MKWLPTADASRTGPAVHLRLVWERDAVLGRTRHVVTPRDSARDAVRRALAWQAMLDAGMTRADIARQEGVSRSWVTQVLRLLAADSATLERILAGNSRVTLRELEAALQGRSAAA